jgi:hypothetical protein
LVVHPKNAKKHPDAHVAKLAKSIQKFGVANPLNIRPDGTIITGHGRRLAALSLGWTQIPVVVRDDLTEAEADALRLSDNQVASTEYDTELLQQALTELAEDGFDMDTIGFDESEITRMTSDFADIDDGMFVDNITTAVEKQKEENSAKEAEVDHSAAPVSDALGFKRVTVEQSRKIRELLTIIEGKVDKTGVDALLFVLEQAA